MVRFSYMKLQVRRVGSEGIDYRLD